MIVNAIDKMVIGKRLVKLRGEKTQKTVADDNDISISALAMYETGKRIPRDEVKIRLAKYFDKTVEELFFN